MQQVYQTKTACCGCAACADICPRDAIRMEGSDEFLYPVIDQELCVDCGACQRVCAFAQPKETDCNTIAAYACRYTDDAVRMNSSSGGVFTALSDAVLQEGGAVYGATYDSAMRVCHVKAETADGRDRMRGSKYVQSNLESVYIQVKADLLRGQTVLFSGTPCQVGALKSYLNKPYDNLILMDIVCHGVPSPLVWERFVDYLRRTYGRDDLVDYRFRNKQVSWRRYSPLAVFSDGTTVGENRHTGSFIELFRYDVCLRPSCTACRYTTVHREGDITISDFWGIEQVHPHLDDGKGVSALLVNSDKGARLVEAIADRVELTPCTPQQVAAGQKNMRESSQHSNRAAAFMQDLKTLPFDAVLKRYTRVGTKRRVIDFVKKCLGR